MGALIYGAVGIGAAVLLLLLGIYLLLTNPEVPHLCGWEDDD